MALKNLKLYEITYYDPNDPKGERIKTWRFKKLLSAKKWQRELENVWKSPKSEFPIKIVRRLKVKR